MAKPKKWSAEQLAAFAKMGQLYTEQLSQVARDRKIVEKSTHRRTSTELADRVSRGYIAFGNGGMEFRVQ